MSAEVSGELGYKLLGGEGEAGCMAAWISDSGKQCWLVFRPQSFTQGSLGFVVVRLKLPRVDLYMLDMLVDACGEAQASRVWPIL